MISNSNFKFLHFLGQHTFLEDHFEFVDFGPFFLFAYSELFFDLADAWFLILFFKIGPYFVDCLLETVPFLFEEACDRVDQVIIQKGDQQRLTHIQVNFLVVDRHLASRIERR